jgi:hypothetical protein
MRREEGKRPSDTDFSLTTPVQSRDRKLTEQFLAPQRILIRQLCRLERPGQHDRNVKYNTQATFNENFLFNGSRSWAHISRYWISKRIN